MADINPQFLAQVAKVAAALDTLDYFQLLRIEPTASPDEIRAGYHRQARTFHPDRYHHLGKPELVAQLTQISKRITEAYVILRDDHKRELYRRQVQGPERPSHLRYTERQEREDLEEQRAAAGKTTQGRQMFAQAKAAYDAGQLAEAIKGLKMALLYEADNALFKETLTQWEEQAS